MEDRYYSGHLFGYPDRRPTARERGFSDFSHGVNCMSDRRPADYSRSGWTRRYFKQGLLFVIPAVVTVGVLSLTFRFASGFLSPVVSQIIETTGAPQLFGELVVLLALLGFVFLLGAVIETIPHGVEAAGVFHSAVESIPGVGTVYYLGRTGHHRLVSGNRSVPILIPVDNHDCPSS